jgi:predicted lysophospholipase L1 biosynthesis ABC-type transport system permease subunit
MVVDTAFAKLFFAGRDPLGKRVVTGRGTNQRTFQIVGVVPSIATANDLVKQPAPPHYYVPWEQRGADHVGLNFILRISTDAAPAFAAARRAVRSVDAALPVEMQTLEEALARFTALERTLSYLAVTFGSVALLLAAIGLYGVLAYGVARRRGEIGIRIALGAERGRVVRLILRESAVVVIGGLALGLWPAYAVSQLVRSQFADFAPQDLWMLAAAVAVLLVVSFAAAYLPARRASRLDPMIALRSE